MDCLSIRDVGETVLGKGNIEIGTEPEFHPYSVEPQIMCESDCLWDACASTRVDDRDVVVGLDGADPQREERDGIFH